MKLALTKRGFKMKSLFQIAAGVAVVTAMPITLDSEETSLNRKTFDVNRNIVHI